MAHSDLFLFLNSITWIFFSFIFLYVALVTFILPVLFKHIRIRAYILTSLKQNIILQVPELAYRVSAASAAMSGFYNKAVSVFLRNVSFSRPLGFEDTALRLNGVLDYWLIELWSFSDRRMDLLENDRHTCLLQGFLTAYRTVTRRRRLFKSKFYCNDEGNFFYFSLFNAPSRLVASYTDPRFFVSPRIDFLVAEENTPDWTNYNVRSFSSQAKFVGFEHANFISTKTTGTTRGIAIKAVKPSTYVYFNVFYSKNNALVNRAKWFFGCCSRCQAIGESKLKL